MTRSPALAAGFAWLFTAIVAGLLGFRWFSTPNWTVGVFLIVAAAIGALLGLRLLVAASKSDLAAAGIWAGITLIGAVAGLLLVPGGTSLLDPMALIVVVASFIGGILALREYRLRTA